VSSLRDWFKSHGHYPALKRWAKLFRPSGPGVHSRAHFLPGPSCLPGHDCELPTQPCTAANFRRTNNSVEVEEFAACDGSHLGP